MRDDPDGRRAAVAARHPRNRPARLGARTLGRRRHQRRAHHGERGAAPGGGRSTGTVPVPRCARSRSSRPFPEGAWAPGKTRWRERRSSTGPGSPSSCRRPRARTISASSRRSPTSRTIASPPRSGTSTSWCRPVAGSSCRTSPPRSTDEVLASLYRIQRKYDRRMLVNAKCAPHYIKTVLESAGAQPDSDPDGRRIGGSALVDPGFVARPVLYQDLLRRGRRMPGGHALHGDTAERRCHALPLPPGLRGDASQLESRGPLDVLGAVRRHSPPHLARRAMRRVRDERALRGLPRAGLRDDRRSDGRRSPLHPHARDVRRVSPAGAHRRAAPRERAASGPHG